MKQTKLAKKIERAQKIRKKIFGTSSVPRLAVFKSLKSIYAQIIDDSKGKTLVSVSGKEIKERGTKTQIAQKIGALIAAKAQKQKISKVVFDRRGLPYHGRIQALAEVARKNGLKF